MDNFTKLLSVMNFFWKCQNMPEYARLLRKMPLNASGMDFTRNWRHFPNPEANANKSMQIYPAFKEFRGRALLLSNILF